MAELDITIEQGATFTRDIVYKDSAGAAINLSNVTSVRGQVRRTYDATTAYSFVCAVTNAATGAISWTMPATTTAQIEPHSVQWVYDLELVYASGVVTRLIEGKAYISPEVTR